MNIHEQFPNKSIECFVEMDEAFSKEMIYKLTDVFHFFKANAVDNESLIRKLHLGYTAMREEAFDFVAEEFPWLEEFRDEFGLSKRLNFLETHGIDKPEFKIHIDGKPGAPYVMFNTPILNCNTDTTTFWVQPKTDFDPVMACENGDSADTKRGATPHLPEDIEYDLIDKTSFTNKCALFRSDIYHGVINSSNKDEYRIMCHWWFPNNFEWREAKLMFGDYV